MRTFVWVDAWQQQCCGERFGVGSSVTWNVTRGENSRDWVGLLLGPEWAARVPYLEDHHGASGSTGREMRGVVRSVHVVTCERRLEHQAAAAVRAAGRATGRGRRRCR